jgi:hypothetical protein
VVNFVPLLLYPVPIEQEVGWTPHLVWIFWGREKSCPPPGVHILDHLACSLFATNRLLYSESATAAPV